MGDSASYPPISSYGMLSDCHSVCLVSRDGSIDWGLLHRFDGRPLFSRILDWRKGGYFRIAPTPPYRVDRHYDHDTNVLVTRFKCDRGILAVTDCMPVEAVRTADGEIRASSYHQLLRRARCSRGSLSVRVEFVPRFDYGLTTPRLQRESAEVFRVFGGADALLLQCDLELELKGTCSCEGEAELREGEEARLALTWTAAERLEELKPIGRTEFDSRVEDTRAFWREWIARCRYRGPYRDRVVRSALVLKGLSYDPTGAIVAAPTACLPEVVGGVRNWDYRYTWLRDASMILEAFFGLGFPEEAERFGRYVWRTTAGHAEELQVLYGVGGERMLGEIELRELEGYRGSRPVRVGNAAARQFQLDVPGHMLGLAALYHEHGGEIDEGRWRFLRGIVDFVAGNWERPDRGLWEIRTEPEHMVHSKVMCWVAVDRAIRIARERGLAAPVNDWTALRSRIRRSVETHGVESESGAFLRSFGSPTLDAASLLIPLTGFVSGADPRATTTTRRVARELGTDGLLRRYRVHDGLPGSEGAFLLCSFWLVDNLVLMGRGREARELFERLLRQANDLGLYPEEVDSDSGELLGNFPQAFSHLGLINSALRLDPGREELR